MNDTTFPRIVCSICKKPVDRLEWFDDYLKDERVIRAYCHGDRDEMRMNSDELYEMSLIGPMDGVAFHTKRLEQA